jgi:hypothetical protein
VSRTLIKVWESKSFHSGRGEPMAIDVAGRLRFRGRTRSGSRNRQAASRDNRRSGVHGVNGLSDGVNPHFLIGWWLNQVASRGLPGKTPGAGLRFTLSRHAAYNVIAKAGRGAAAGMGLGTCRRDSRRWGSYLLGEAQGVAPEQ